MKKLVYIITLLIGATTMAQTITVNGTPMLVSDDISFPFWLESGSSISPEVPVSSISVLEFNIVPNNNGNDMVFNQVISVTEGQTVPEGKTWKVESVLMENLIFDTEENNSLNLIDNGNFLSTNESGLHIKFHEPYLISSSSTIALRADILPGGGSGVDYVGFCYSLSNSSPTLDDENYFTQGYEINTTVNHFMQVGFDLLPDTTYYIRAFVSNVEGITYSDTYMFNTNELYVGLEYQGGIIFYLDSTNTHGYIFAESNYGQHSLSCDPNNIPNNSSSFGKGSNNSYEIANSNCDCSALFNSILQYDLNGYTDWFVPSYNELYHISRLTSWGDPIFENYNLNDGSRQSYLSCQRIESFFQYDEWFYTSSTANYNYNFRTLSVYPIQNSSSTNNQSIRLIRAF